MHVSCSDENFPFFSHSRKVKMFMENYVNLTNRNEHECRFFVFLIKTTVSNVGMNIYIVIVKKFNSSRNLNLCVVLRSMFKKTLEINVLFKTQKNYFSNTACTVEKNY